jgi:archaeal flagellar protein FlaI
LADFGTAAPGKILGKKVPAVEGAPASSDIAEAVTPPESSSVKPVEPEAAEKIAKPGIPSQKKPKFSLKSLFKKKDSRGSKPSEAESTVLDTDMGEVKINRKQGIGQIFNPKFEDSEELEFNVGEVSLPKHGVPQTEIDVTYEIKAPFQYARVYYNGEDLVHEGIEPPLRESELKYLDIIEKAFERMSSSDILVVDEKERRKALEDRFLMIIRIYRINLTQFQKDKMFYYLMKRYLGYGKIDLLMNEPYVEDITCNGPGTYIYINHRFYGSIKSDVTFEEVELNNFVMKIAQISGRHISLLQPIRDATLPDGSRANLTLGREVTKKGSTFTIRRFKSNPISCIDLMRFKTFDSIMLAYLWIIIERKRSILASGGTASGKTTTLNALGTFIPHEYKIVSIEDTAELNLLHPNWTQSVTRVGFGGEAGGSGKSKGDIELYDLLKAALRQRPEYIFVGEVRGEEANTLFQAISVGHPCMGTIHAGTMQELLSRVESEPMNVPRNLFAGLDVVVFNAMVKHGEHFIRRVMRVVEIVEVDPEKGDLVTNPVFKWNAVDDTYEFSGTSAMFADIEEEFGIPEDELVEEMYTRSRVLEWLYENNVVDYEKVNSAVRDYLRMKNAQEEKE